MKSSFMGLGVVSWFFVSACGQDPSFTEKTFDGSKADVNSADDGVNAGTKTGSSDASRMKSKSFAFGKNVTPVVADYLFVLDNSISMVKYSQKVANGLAAIPQSSFPESSKLAVMTTMVAVNPLAPTLVTHPDINRQDYTCIDREPGFLELVTAESIRQFRGCAGARADYVAKYALDGCEQGWFGPFDQNAAGQRCFSAALQNSFSPIGCEAGLLALEQMLQRNEGRSVFRKGAAVNVIFVSDEQEGCKSPSTRGQYSHAEKLTQMIKQNSNSSSVKFHGIVPTTVSEGIRKYTTEIATTGGIAIPMDQERTDYRDVIQKIIESKADLISSNFDLGEIVQVVTKVEIDGQATSNFEFDGQRIVKIQNLDPTKPTKIVIHFY